MVGSVPSTGSSVLRSSTVSATSRVGWSCLFSIIQTISPGSIGKACHPPNSAISRVATLISSSSTRAECMAISVIASKSSGASTMAGLCSSLVDVSSRSDDVGGQSPCDAVSTGPSPSLVLSGTSGFALSVAITDRIWCDDAPINVKFWPTWRALKWVNHSNLDCISATSSGVAPSPH